MSLAPSELILNRDGSVYHLNLIPEDLADCVLLVGDPERVPLISRHFDSVEVRKSKREFITHTGRLEGRRISVVSTGIGADNIDIVLNELDALASLDLDRRIPLDKPRSLELIRVGTSGALQHDVPVDSFVLSDYGMGFDGLLHYYQSESVQRPDIQLAFLEQTRWEVLLAVPYVVPADIRLCEQLDAHDIIRGITATNPGFYAPQGRQLRLQAADPGLLGKLTSFQFEDLRILNMEMETAAILGMAGLMGHRAASLSCVLANRAEGSFSANPRETIERLIAFTLERLLRS